MSVDNLSEEEITKATQKVLDKLSDRGFKYLIERNLKEGGDPEFFNTLGNSKFYKSLYAEGVLLGLHSSEHFQKELKEELNV